MAQENQNQNKNQQQDENQLLAVRSAQKGSASDENQLLAVRREKLAAFTGGRKRSVSDYKFDVTHHSQDVKDDFDALRGRT